MRRSVVALAVLLCSCAKPPPPSAAPVVQAEPEVVPAPPVPAPPAVSDPPLALVGEQVIEWAAFDELYALKADKHLRRGRTPSPRIVLLYRRSVAQRLVRHEQLRQAAAEADLDYSPTDLARSLARRAQGIDDWERHLERVGETEQTIEAIAVAELRARMLLERVGDEPPTPSELDEAFADMVRLNGTTGSIAWPTKPE